MQHTDFNSAAAELIQQRKDAPRPPAARSAKRKLHIFQVRGGDKQPVPGGRDRDRQHAVQLVIEQQLEHAVNLSAITGQT